ncbi:hypothetical protein [Amycolatopsis eburnea]|uniref:Uncharacterized protein n=1 Tax=Amycolatopsis eburnea TaxID=2267691 RepID=A0A3R9FH77_9PSEU|nr:hypothetical protein [Amycolatopsis eburnea]RSD26356.1 hypothetical protein EIY87_00395 [Amycolatopsis eburnea]
MVIRIRVPKVSSMLLANVLFVLGLLGIAITVGGLAGAWWGGLTGSILAAGLGYLSMWGAGQSETAAAAPVDEGQALRAVEEPAAA